MEDFATKILKLDTSKVNQRIMFQLKLLKKNLASAKSFSF